MHMKDDGFLKRERAFIEKGVKKDCIMLDTFGKKECLKISNDSKSSQYTSLRNNELEKRKRKFKMNEAEIFFLIGTKKNQGTDFKYISKDMITNASKDSGEWNRFKSVANVRMCGVLSVNETVLPVYNIKNHNIGISYLREKTYSDRVATFLNKENLFPDERILLADSFDILERFYDMIFDERLSKVYSVNLGVSDEKNKPIFERYSYRNDDKVYLFVNIPDQTNLIDLFTEQELERNIKNYIKGINYEKIHSLENENKKIETTYYKLSTYETNNEVGFEFVQQELHKIFQTVVLLKEYMEKGIEPRKIKIYGLKENYPIFETLFARYPNTEFVEIKKEKITNQYNN